MKLKKIKVNCYSELEKIKKLQENEFIIDLEDSPINQRKRIIDFVCGLTFLNGSIKKLNHCQFEIQIVKNNNL